MSEQLSLVRISNCQITDTSAEFKPGLSFEEWIDTGRKLMRAATWLQWALGDWMVYGVKGYGDRSKVAREAARELGMNEETLLNYTYVSEHVSVPLRSGSLEWSAHREVAPMKLSDQQHWLGLASENKWSVSQLRQAIRASQAEVKESTSSPSSFSVLGWATEGLRWFKQRMNEKPIDQWPREQRNALKEGLRPIVEVYERL